MAGLYIFGAIVVISIIVFAAYKIKWNRDAKAAENARKGLIEARIKSEQAEENKKTS